ncbi:MAG: sulfatase-like hydrolase/transferase, partial [Rhodothermales bacterium]
MNLMRFALLALILWMVPASAFAQAPPNVVVFVADDAGWRDFGAYGSDVVRTPNIDALAEEGLRVERAFLTIAQCSPSRISILTGKYPHATGAEDLHMPLPEGERLLPSYLAE